MCADDVSRYLVDHPPYEVTPPAVEGRTSPMTLMSRNLVPEANVYVEGGWIFGPPDPNPHILEHTHNYDELVIHVGSDPENPEDLGAEIEFMLDGKPLLISRTSCVFVPKGMKHGPLTWKRFTRPHIELTVMLGAGTLAEADPGGHLAASEQKDTP
ncbi:MAG: hypothetical protein N3B14_05135 [Thermoleophilia bacterium]|nr:hypothetical protein [Thermoleophilia bacterium]